MALPDAAASYYRDQQRISGSTVLLARRLWSRLGYGDFDQAWIRLGPLLLAALMTGQRAAVARAVDYVPVVLDELNINPDPVAEVAPAALVGIASDGRPLESLLYQTVIRTRTALGEGLPLVAALDSGQSLLDDIVSQQVVDAGRAAESVATVVRPEVTGYIRMLNLPSCQRCVVLAGHFYRWNAGFSRHPPTCDCRHIPATENVAGDLRTDPLAAIKAGRVTGLSAKDTRAIVEDGADVAKVINAHRGMSTEQVFGQRLKVTTEGTSRRAGNVTVRTKLDGKTVNVRLRPAAIYKLAGDNRTEAIRLLRQYGYLTA